MTGYTSSTQSQNFPVWDGPDVTYNGGTTDAFVAKVLANGSWFSYCGYIGGLNSDYGRSIAVDGSGNAYVVGDTLSNQNSFPVISGPSLVQNGGSDAFVAKTNDSGSDLVSCGYIGGSLDDYGTGVARDSSGRVYVAGYTDSTQASFPVTVGPYLSANGNDDAFVAVLTGAPLLVEFGGVLGRAARGSGLRVLADMLRDRHRRLPRLAFRDEGGTLSKNHRCAYFGPGERSERCLVLVRGCRHGFCHRLLVQNRGCRD